MTAYSTGWIGTAFWVVLILVLIVGSAINIIGTSISPAVGAPPIQPPA